MPAYAGRINEMHFPAPGKILRRIETNSGIYSVQFFLANCCPPGIQIRHRNRHHVVLGEVLVGEVLQNELGRAVSETGAAAALPRFLKTDVRKKSAAAGVVGAARNKWRQGEDT